MTTPLETALIEQADHCEALDSPFMGRMLRILAKIWPNHTALAAKVAAWPGDIGPMADGLPLRIAGGLHALTLTHQDIGLGDAYPPNAVSDQALSDALIRAIETHDAFLCAWIDTAPQTNEVRRAAPLIATAHLLADRFGLPLCISELGASGGLNLMFDAFALQIENHTYGPEDAQVTLSPEWRGALPPHANIEIAERRGVDLNPLDPSCNADALRLMAYLWPDQRERLNRTQAAIDLHDATLDQGDAIAWLDTHLTDTPDRLHLIYHTIAWQYFPTEAQAKGTALIQAQGARATTRSPLAWLSMESDGQAPGAALTLRVWPGDLHVNLGRVDFHGRWVDWQAPAKLPLR